MLSLTNVLSSSLHFTSLRGQWRPVPLFQAAAPRSFPPVQIPLPFITQGGLQSAQIPLPSIKVKKVVGVLVGVFVRVPIEVPVGAPVKVQGLQAGITTTNTGAGTEEAVR
jgi:hypothetical protein